MIGSACETSFLYVITIEDVMLRVFLPCGSVVSVRQSPVGCWWCEGREGRESGVRGLWPPLNLWKCNFRPFPGPVGGSRGRFWSPLTDFFLWVKFKRNPARFRKVKKIAAQIPIKPQVGPWVFISPRHVVIYRGGEGVRRITLLFWARITDF